MKKLTKQIFTGVILASMLLMSGCGAKETTDQLKIGIKSDVPGFGFFNPETKQYEGFEIDIAYEIAAKKYNCSIEEAKERDLIAFQAVTAKTRGPLLNNGELDMVIATFTITDERKESYNFSEPYFTDSVRILVKKDNGIATLSDLDQKSIGIAQSSTTRDMINAFIAENNLSTVPEYLEFGSYPEIKAALDSNRIQAFSVDGSILAGYNDDTTILLEERFAPQDYGIATAKSNEATELDTIINEVIAELKSSGKLDEILTANGIEQ